MRALTQLGSKYLMRDQVTCSCSSYHAIREFPKIGDPNTVPI